MRIVDQLLWSEALAYPLASLGALETEGIDLEHDAWGFPAGSAKDLANRFDQHAQHLLSGRGLTLEFVRSVLPQAWFGSERANSRRGETLRLDQYVRRLAKALLDVPDQQIVLKPHRRSP